MATPPREQQSPAPDPPSDELRLTRLEEHAAEIRAEFHRIVQQ